jgi:hypothetical protein
MKGTFAHIACLLVLRSFAAAQSVCPQATTEVVKHMFDYTVNSLSWLSVQHGVLRATATIPDGPLSGRSYYGIVFSFSTLASSEPKQSVDMLPLAMELSKQGRPTIVIERKLTWPEIDPSVGTMQADVMCAQQWLSTHAAVDPNHWRIVGPDSDAPKPEEFDELGDKTSMTFWVIFPVGDQSQNTNTENLLRSTKPIQKWLFAPFLDQ